MKSLRYMASALLVSSAAALLGAGCAVSDEAVNDGTENENAVTGNATEEVTVSSVQEEVRRRRPRHGRGRGRGRGRGGRGGGFGGGGFGGGGGGGPGTNACEVLDDGAYCGGNEVKGNPDTLYRCSNGHQSRIRDCSFGCVRETSGVADHCA